MNYDNDFFQFKPFNFSTISVLPDLFSQNDEKHSWGYLQKNGENASYSKANFWDKEGPQKVTVD